MRVRLSHAARVDLRRQIDWLSEQSPKAGRKAVDRIFAMVSLLSDFPYLGERLSGSVREKQVRFGRDGFVIRYDVRPDEVFVERIFHTRQDRYR